MRYVDEMKSRICVQFLSIDTSGSLTQTIIAMLAVDKISVQLFSSKLDKVC